jgi:hypothetical protein
MSDFPAGYVLCLDPECEANQMPIMNDGTRGYRHAHPEDSTWPADRLEMGEGDDRAGVVLAGVRGDREPGVRGDAVAPVTPERPMGAERALLGKQVEVVLERVEGVPQVVARGQLLRVADSGEFVLLDDAGFCHYAWPMLEIREVEGD